MMAVAMAPEEPTRASARRAREHRKDPFVSRARKNARRARSLERTMSDFDAWEPQEPPRGFAERVVAEAKPKKKNRTWAIGLALVAAAAAIVLEPGAHVAWKGDELMQDSGDVFYRVEPGAPLVVHTPSGT